MESLFGMINDNCVGVFIFITFNNTYLHGLINGLDVQWLNIVSTFDTFLETNNSDELSSYFPSVDIIPAILVVMLAS